MLAVSKVTHHDTPHGTVNTSNALGSNGGALGAALRARNMGAVTALEVYLAGDGTADVEDVAADNVVCRVNLALVFGRIERLDEGFVRGIALGG